MLALRALAGDEERARGELAEDPTDAAFARGLVHAVLGDVDRAFELWLNETEWTIQLPTLFRYGPMLDGIRDDPRYPRVLARIDEQWGW